MNFRDDLKAYLDGELPPIRMAEMSEAVQRDPELARELSELQSISLAVRSTAPEYRVVGLDQTLRALSRKERPKFGWLALPLGLGAAAILLAVFLRPNQMNDAAAFRKSPATVDSPISVLAGAAASDMAKSAPSSQEKVEVHASTGKGEFKSEQAQLKGGFASPVVPPEAKPKRFTPPSHAGRTQKTGAGLDRSSATGTVTLGGISTGSTRESNSNANMANSPPVLLSNGQNRTKSAYARPATDALALNFRERRPAAETAPIVIEAVSVSDAEAQLRTVMAPYAARFDFARKESSKLDANSSQNNLEGSSGPPSERPKPKGNISGGNAFGGGAGGGGARGGGGGGFGFRDAKSPGDRTIVFDVLEERADEAVKAIHLLAESTKTPVRDFSAASKSSAEKQRTADAVPTGGAGRGGVGGGGFAPGTPPAAKAPLADKQLSVTAGKKIGAARRRIVVIIHQTPPKVDKPSE
ncbi:anti-sigma factor family protein [Fimbriimonas ginsengisoli]|uniref:Uncharacterized protein n=1 Tax=Fimbriimonas ginsengisoli Gsoil 348 TaxID=661478 RepID=A0A068NY19_FIMGI|nr:hypothetical protein [Fimbriimonas ginsengisoli]AIE86559.1 hypothetical protein OP10G_3191 [Fimbriimonas ginsengisoli Gsoil 348]